MKLSNEYLKIASEIYTYLKNADNDENSIPENTDESKLFKQIKSLILAHKQDEAVKYINKYSPVESFKNIIDRKDVNGYTLLMIASSNGLQKVVKILLQNRANPYITILLKGKLFNTIFNSKIKNGELSDEQIEQLSKNKKIQTTALDIAKAKNKVSVINILNKFQ